MQYRQLGPTGIKISALSFGAWVTFGKQIGDPVARQLLHAAYDAGVNFFDNAEAYADGRAELVMGGILEGGGVEAQQLSGLEQGLLRLRR